MALQKFYKKGNMWVLADMVLPSGLCIKKVAASGEIKIVSISTPNPEHYNPFLAKGFFGDFCDEAGNAYASMAAFEAATNAFFVAAPIISDNGLMPVNISTISKGLVSVVHNAIVATATSAIIDCTGFNACLVSSFINGVGSWNVALQGALAADGNFMPLEDNQGNTLETGTRAASVMKLFAPIPNFLKIVATELADGAAITVKIQPINI